MKHRLVVPHGWVTIALHCQSDSNVTRYYSVFGKLQIPDEYQDMFDWAQVTLVAPVLQKITPVHNGVNKLNAYFEFENENAAIEFKLKFSHLIIDDMEGK